MTYDAAMRFAVVALSCCVACSSSDAGGVAGGGGSGRGTGGSAGSSGSAGAQPSGGTAGLAGNGGSGGAMPDPCEPIGGVSYSTSATAGPVTDHPAAEHADLNLELRGWSPTTGTLGLVDVNGPTDALAPKLNTLLSDDRVPTFVQNYKVNEWDWSTNTRAGPITTWEVTLTGMQVAVGEVLELPNSGYDIGGGKQARVLFADEDSITFKYTSEDNVVTGYTIHVQDICVEPKLLALYQEKNAAGRSELPALSGNQPFGRARSTEVLVAIRDTGAFMDPRVKKDWW